MHLRDYLKSKNLQMAEFGRALGTTGPTVCRIAGGQVPRKAMMLQIFEETGGLVTPNDIVGVRCVRPCDNSMSKEKE